MTQTSIVMDLKFQVYSLQIDLCDFKNKLKDDPPPKNTERAWLELFRRWLEIAIIVSPLCSEFWKNLQSNDEDLPEIGSDLLGVGLDIYIKQHSLTKKNSEKKGREALRQQVSGIFDKYLPGDHVYGVGINRFADYFRSSRIRLEVSISYLEPSFHYLASAQGGLSC